MELNIVERPSLNKPHGTNGEKPMRFVKRHRFKAKREQKGDGRVGLGSVKIKEAPVVGPEPTAVGKGKGKGKVPEQPKAASPASSILHKKRRLVVGQSQEEQVEEQQPEGRQGKKRAVTDGTRPGPITAKSSPSTSLSEPMAPHPTGREPHPSASAPLAAAAPTRPSPSPKASISMIESAKDFPPPRSAPTISPAAHTSGHADKAKKIDPPGALGSEEEKEAHFPKTKSTTAVGYQSTSVLSSKLSKTDDRPKQKTVPSELASYAPSFPSRKYPVPATATRLDEYHLKPSELDLATKAPSPSQSSPSTSSSITTAKGKSSKHIFTATPFSALGLHAHLVSVLGTPKEHHGFGLKVATRIQSASLPALLSPSRPNALLCSETGSGKTLAYLLPLLQHLQSITPRPTRAEGTRAIVVAPTRELCHQICDVLSLLVRAFIWVVPGLVSGGEKRKSEKARLRKGVMVLVGTPGRLLDHLQNSQSFNHEAAEWLVLDEVDRLLDLGFEAQVREIVGRLRGKEGGKEAGRARPRLQVLAASATMNPALDRFGRELLGEHVRIDAKMGTVIAVAATMEAMEGEEEEKEVEGEEEENRCNEEDREGEPGERGRHRKSNADIAHSAGSEGGEQFTTPLQLVQQYMVVTCKLRLPALACFLRVHTHAHKTVVFFSTCDSVDFHHALFRAARWPDEPWGTIGEGNDIAATSSTSLSSSSSSLSSLLTLLGHAMPVHRLHGNIPQAERMHTFRTFREATRGVLFCTDVAARGLDLPAVDWIVQYDPPTEAAEYVHRVGRTARRGRKGHALLFLLPSEQGYLDVLKKRGIAPTPLSLQQTLFQATPVRFRGRFRAPEEVFCLEIQQRFERTVETDKGIGQGDEKGADGGGGKAGTVAALTTPPLLTLGRKAFGSFVRAYATHPAELKPIFAVRALHLGHVAKSFALKEPPTSLKVGKEVIKIPGSGSKGKDKKESAGGGGAGGDDGRRSGRGSKRKEYQARKTEDGGSTRKSFSPPRQQPPAGKGKPRTLTAFSSVSEFSAG
eukprot:evm.model.NODE_820_length_30357_cov_40.359653.5